MKKILLGLFFAMFALQVNAATLSLTTAGTSGPSTSQSVSVVNNNGPLASGTGETTGGSWWSQFNLTTDVATSAQIEWSFNKEAAVTTAVLSFGSNSAGIIDTWNATGDFITNVMLSVGETYWVDFYSIESSPLNYDVSVSQVPVPAAVWLFGSALMGLFGASRRKSTAVAA